MMSTKKEDIWLGFDCGDKTGFGVWDRKKKELTQVFSGSFWEVFYKLEDLMAQLERDGLTVRARIEDTRKDNVVYRAVRYFNKIVRTKSKEAAIGGVSKMGRNVGKNDRDCALWEDYFKRKGIRVDKVAPSSRHRNIDLKISAETFKSRTGWEGRTNEHSRDAAMLVFCK